MVKNIWGQLEEIIIKIFEILSFQHKAFHILDYLIMRINKINYRSDYNIIYKSFASLNH